MAMLALATLAVAAGPRALAQGQGGGRWGRQAGQHVRGPGPHRGEWLRKHQNLSPAEQEKALRNDPAFQHLPPERQQRLIERLRNFNSLPPEQRQRILERMETFEHLPPAERQQLRSFYGQMRDLPVERRLAVRQAVRQLSGMTPAERERTLNSPQFRQRFSPQEQNLVRGLAQFEPGQR
jgi:hypothetical protein